MVHGKFQHNPICNFREKVKQRNVAYYRLVVFTRSNWVLYAYKITLWCLIKGKYFSQKRPPPPVGGVNPTWKKREEIQLGKNNDELSKFM